MSKKGFWDNVIHDMQDYNCDGEVDSLDELQYWDDIEAEEKAERERLSHNDWQLYCEDGTEYGLDPYDFDDEDEYLAALDSARSAEDDYLTDEDDSSDDEVVNGGNNSSITLTFSLAEPKRTKPTTGVWKYYDESWDLWDFAQAMIDAFPELAEDYESGSDSTLPNIITETFEIDRPRAIKYLKWLWSTFTPDYFKDEKESPWCRHSYKCRGALIYRLLIENEEDYGLYKLLKNDEAFIKAAFYEGIADKHDYELAKEYIGLMLAKNDFDAAQTMYNHYLKGHQGRYSDNDLGKLWLDLIYMISWSNLSRPKKIKLVTQVIPIVESLGVRGKKPKRQIDEYLKEWNRKD